jgi:hypothetical protein
MGLSLIASMDKFSRQFSHQNRSAPTAIAVEKAHAKDRRFHPAAAPSLLE